MEKKKSKIVLSDVRHILNAINYITGITIRDLRSHKRDRDIFFARMIFSRYCNSKFTLYAIAYYLRIKSHGTILHHLQQFEIDNEVTNEFKALYEQIENELTKNQLKQEKLSQHGEIIIH
jgi:chromosomal replication initiation ATPase DnaA